MELQSEVLTPKTFMIYESTLSNIHPPFENQPEVNRTRKILLILISILLIICFINCIFVIHSYTTNSSPEIQTLNSSSQLILIIILSIYYGFGFLVTYRYYQTGLLVFAWLGFISLLLILAIVIVFLIGIIITTSHLGFVNVVIIAYIFIVMFFSGSIIQIFGVRYAFVLSKLLKHTKRFTNEHI